MKLAHRSFCWPAYAGSWFRPTTSSRASLESGIGRRLRIQSTSRDFVGLGLTLQIVFLNVACDPVGHRGVMPAGILEKFFFAFALYVLFASQRVDASMAAAATTDLFLAMHFIAALVKTPTLERSPHLQVRRRSVEARRCKLLILKGRSL